MANDIEIDGKKLIVKFDRNKINTKEQTNKKHQVNDKPLIINIIGEEMGYNVKNKEYKTILIDRPLIMDSFYHNRKGSPILALSKRLTSGSQFKNPPQLIQRIGPKRCLRDQGDCSRYLESISQEITVSLEFDVRLMQSNYIILSKFLDDASQRIKSICEFYVPKYEQKLSQTTDSPNSDIIYQPTIDQAIRISIENYIIYLLHGKLMASIFALYEQHDNKMISKFDEIQKLSPNISTLGAQKIFSDFHITDDLVHEIASLPNLQSPLAIMSCISRSIELINDCLNQNVKFKSLIGMDNSSSQTNDLVTICSDDLIACLVYCFINVKPTKLYSISKYLSTFGRTSTSRDAYYAATFQLVVQYIYSYANTSQRALKACNFILRQ